MCANSSLIFYTHARTHSRSCSHCRKTPDIVCSGGDGGSNTCSCSFRGDSSSGRCANSNTNDSAVDSSPSIAAASLAPSALFLPFGPIPDRSAPRPLGGGRRRSGRGCRGPRRSVWQAQCSIVGRGPLLLVLPASACFSLFLGVSLRPPWLSSTLFPTSLARSRSLALAFLESRSVALLWEGKP